MLFLLDSYNGKMTNPNSDKNDKKVIVLLGS